MNRLTTLVREAQAASRARAAAEEAAALATAPADLAALVPELRAMSTADRHVDVGYIDDETGAYCELGCADDDVLGNVFMHITDHQGDTTTADACPGCARTLIADTPAGHVSAEVRRPAATITTAVAA